MPYQVTATGLSSNITESQVVDFFSFCGKVNAVSIEDSQDDSGTKTAKVTFDKAAAVKTAVLLGGSELGGSQVHITADEEALKEADESGGTPENAGAQSPQAKTNEEDIGQEYKPRSAILAEYLSHGYVLGDKVISRGLALDEKHGIYNRFTHFLTNLDQKYHVRDRAEATDKAYGIRDNLQKQGDRLTRYFDSAIQTPTGSKLHSYYTQLVKDVNAVHQEARRLADLKNAKEQQSSEPTSTSAPSSEKS